MNPFEKYSANFDQNRLNQYMMAQQQQSSIPQPQPQKKKKGFLVDNISTVGGIVGGLGGGALGGLFGAGVGALPGAAAGGAAGSGFGEMLENILTGEDLTKNVAKEAILGGIFSAGPVKLAKFGLGAGAALASGGEAAAGGVVKGLAEGAAKKAVGETAEQAGEQVLKTSLKGRLVSAGNEALKSQYGTISKPVARATNPGQTIGKLADMGIIKPMDAERTAQAITGSDGILTQQVAKAIGSAGKVPVNGVGKVLEDSITKNSLKGLSKGTALENTVKAHVEGINAAGGSPESVITAIRSLEGQMADLLGKGGTYHLPTSTDKNMAKALREVTDHLKDQLYNAAGANKNISGVLTPEIRNQLIKIHPNNMKWQSFVDNTVMKAKNVGDLRSAQSPFVNIQKIIDEADLNSMTFGGRLGNLAKGQGSLPGLVIGGAADLAKNPAARVAGETLRDIGTGQALNQGTKSLRGMAGGLGSVNFLANTLMPDTVGGDAPAPTEQTGQPNNLQDALMMQSGMGSGAQNGFGGVGSMGGSNQSQSPSDTSGNPYGIEALKYDLQRDPANAGKYIEIYNQLAEIFSPAASMPKLNATQVQQQNTAIAGQQALQDIAGFIGQNPGVARAEALPGPLRNMAGAGSYHTAIQQATDAIGRLRSGGAISGDEEARFRSFLPSAFDDPETVRYKLSTLNSIFSRFSDPATAAASTPATLQDALMQQGGY